MYLKVDAIAKIFLLFSTFVWLISAFYAFLMYKEKQKASFWFWFLLTYFGNMMLCISDDVISFYLFFSLMSLSAFGMIIATQSKEAKQAGFVYLKYAIVGEVAVFFGLIAWVLDAQSMQFIEFINEDIAWEFWLLFLGFGIKIGVVFLHQWLPLAHSNAPVAASAVLSAVMLKAGVLGWLRFFPPYINNNETMVSLFLVLGFLGIVLGLKGVFEKKIKVVLAYSSISQMGFIVLMFAVAFNTPQQYDFIVFAILFFMVHHSFNKAALFLLCHEIVQHGLKGFNFIFALIAAMSLVGIPFTSGALAKSLLKDESTLLFVNGAFFIGSIITALLMLRFLQLAKQQTAQKNDAPSSSVMLIAVLIICSIGCAYLFDFNYSFSFAALVPIFIALILLLLLKKYYKPYDGIKNKSSLLFLYDNQRKTKNSTQYIISNSVAMKLNLNFKTHLKSLEMFLNKPAILFFITLTYLCFAMLWFLF
jgi:multicomponent Na+:H+ antiporter subunit D